MLHELHIESLGVIDSLDLVLGSGLTALTGETGAGKTMLVEAITLLVGGRADATMVRPNAAEARVEGRFVVWSDSEQSVSVPLPIGPVAIRTLKVDGQDGTVQPLVIGVQGTELPDFANQQIMQQQQVAPSNSIQPSGEGPAYAVQVTGKGLHIVDLIFEISALIEGELGRADFPLRNAASGTLEWTLPADGLDAKVNGRTNVYRRDGRTVILPIAQLSTLRLQWLPTVQKGAGDVVFHANVASAMALQDSGIVLRTTVAVTCRQGEISELEVTIPEGYSVQSVTGDRRAHV